MRTSNQIKKGQRGISFLELLTVISIMAILAYISAPSYVDAVAFKDLNSAKTTLIQTLYRAKNTASRESTSVTVTVSNNQITLSPANTAATTTVNLPKNIQFSNDSDSIRFNALGEVFANNGNPNGNILASNKTFTIHAEVGSGVSETITITPMGLILIMPALPTVTGG